MKPIVKILSFGLSSLLVSTIFTGCFKEKASCDGDSTKNTLKSLLDDNKDKVIAHILLQDVKQERLKNKTSNPYFDQMVANGQADDMMLAGIIFAKDDPTSPMHAKYVKLLSEYDKAEFNLHDSLTVSKDKETNRVECKGTVDYVMGSKTYPLKLEYSSQPTDDGKSIYVEVSSIEN